MTLHRYFAWKFLRAFGGLTLVFAVMITLLDTVEQLRRFDAAEIALSGALELALLSMPEALYRILPLVVILSTIALFLGLARTSELVVTRAAGRSALRALVAPVLVAALLGAASVALFNPIVAATIQRYEARSAEISGEGGSVLSVSPEGLWLRQGDAAGQTVIRAERANADATTLYEVTFIEFGPPPAARPRGAAPLPSVAAEDRSRGGRQDGTQDWMQDGTQDGTGAALPLRRIEAASATLTPGAWALEDAKIWPLDRPNPEAEARRFAELRLPSTLTREEMLDSFGTPASVPIWDLPGYIERLTAAGFSARLHRVWLQMELALPLFFAGMVMMAAGTTMRHTRFGRTGVMVLVALLLGFGVYFIRNFAQILGETGQIPVPLAAWAPPVAAILLSLGLLLHLEDG